MRVRDSQAYRKMDVTRERISRTLELREIFLSFQTGFNLVNAAVVCAILESISGLEPSSVITGPRTFTVHQTVAATRDLHRLPIPTHSSTPLTQNAGRKIVDENLGFRES